MSVSHYVDTAQYCRNGHEITQRAATQPKQIEDFCSICGAATIAKCEKCEAPIRGFNHMRVGGYATPRPNHCYKCGAQFPWVAEQLAAGREMIEFVDGLSDDEREGLKRSLEDIVAEGPRTQLGVLKFKAGISKLQKGARDVLYKVAVDVASETAKKMLTGG
jgi:hypothetical protein